MFRFTYIGKTGDYGDFWMKSMSSSVRLSAETNRICLFARICTVRIQTLSNKYATIIYYNLAYSRTIPRKISYMNGTPRKIL